MATTDCVHDGELSKDFMLGGTKSLRPIVFSPGLSAHKEVATGLFKDFASHGYLVISLDHQDGTCIYTTNK